MLKCKRILRIIIAIVLFSVLLTGCVIVYDDENGNSPQTGSEYLGNKSYNSAEYCETIWDSELIPYMQEKAVDITTLIAALKENPDKAMQDYGSKAQGAQNEETFIAKGIATVLEVKTDTSVGLMVMDADKDGAPDFNIQIGTVVKSSALRDCTPFIKFDLFADQMEFAAVSRELNKMSLTKVIDPLGIDKIQGKRLEFLAAFNYQGVQADQIMMVTVALSESE